MLMSGSFLRCTGLRTQCGAAIPMLGLTSQELRIVGDARRKRGVTAHGRP